MKTLFALLVLCGTASAIALPVTLHWKGSQSEGTLPLFDNGSLVHWYSDYIPWNEPSLMTESWVRIWDNTNQWRNNSYWETVDADTVRLRLNTLTKEEAWLVMPAECRAAPPSGAAECALSGLIEIYEPIRDTATLSLVPIVEPDLRADLTGDGTIDAADASLLFASWGWSEPVFDINGDGYQDAADAAIMFETWTGDAAPVPEPGFPLAFLLFSFLARGRCRRRGFQGTA